MRWCGWEETQDDDPASRRAVTGRAGSGSFQRLLEVASGLEFRPHRIGHLLDARGRHTLELPAGFPFAISLFHFREGAVTRRPTWHERLELLIPLDGPMTERMGDLEAALEPGDVLVVDHLKPHQVADSPGLDSRVVVLSFLPECLFSAGSPPTDAAFLIPFHRSIEGAPMFCAHGHPSRRKPMTRWRGCCGSISICPFLTGRPGARRGCSCC